MVEYVVSYFVLLYC